ncbi:Uncharacterised protein [BD1-7 clade bacterium]|uniref:IcmF-related N-terminal domain-containing protein n=1 Tax=BD1-7 clade bacterium TaxID=2029982 RepID=A0A5S9N3N1_9GAMM|nr:Uncharacterised protein [BD1-7 clade bacterium]
MLKKKGFLIGSIIALILSATSGFLVHYLKQPQLLQWAITLPMLLISFLMSGIHTFINRKTKQPPKQTPDDSMDAMNPGEDQAQLIKQDIELIRQLFDHAVHEMRKRQPSSHDSLYRKPWYLMIGTESSGKSSFLTQNLLDPLFVDDDNRKLSDYLVFWWNEHQVVIEICPRIFDNDGADNPLWQCVLQQLMKYRPRQAINGIIYNTDAGTIVNSEPQKLKMLAQEARQAILELYKHTRLSIPVYVLISQSDSVSDFTHFFEAYEATARDKPMGIRLPQKRPVALDQEQLKASCEKMLKDLATQQMQHLHVARKADEALSIMALPYQLDPMMTQIQQFLATLSVEIHQRKVVWLRGFFLASTFRRGRSNDLLSRRIAHDLGFNVKPSEQHSQLKRSFFSSTWVSSVLLPEAGLAGINRFRNRLYLGLRVLGLMVVVTAISLFSTKMADDWSEFLAFKEDALEAKHSYNEQLAKLSNPDTADFIAPLLGLRELVERARKLDNWSNLVAPDVSHTTEALRESYLHQLQIWLFPKLEHALNRSLRDSLHAADAQREFELMYYYKALYNVKTADYSSLELFLVDALQNQMMINQAQRQDLTVLMDDLLNSKLPNLYPRDEALLRQVSVELQGIPPDRLIYQRLKSLTPWNEIVDIRSQFGTDFDKVFVFTRAFTGYEIPLLFTSAGYSQLDISPDSPLIQELAREYKELLNDNSETTSGQMVALSNRLQTLYFAEYVRYWKNLADNIQIAQIQSDQSLFQALQSLSNTTNNPLIQVLDTLTTNTKLARIGLKSQGEEAKSLINRLEMSSDLEKKTDAAARKKLISDEPAYIVDNAFLQLHQYTASTTDEKGKPTPSALNDLIGSIQKTDTTIDLARREKDADKALYDWAKKQVKGQTEGVLDTNIVKQAAPAPVERWVSQMQNILWRYVLSATKDYMNQQWYENVYQVYQASLADLFPLSEKGRGEASYKAFSDFFKPQGTVDKYVASMLEPFVVFQNGRWQVNDIRGQKTPIDPYFLNQLQQVQKIRLLFFGESQKLSLPIHMRAVSMSPDATHFDVTADQALFSYAQGPRIWRNLEWPIDSQSETIKVSFFNNAGVLATQTYAGNWALLRFLFAGEERVNAESGNIVTMDYQNNVETIRLQYRIRDEQQRLTPQLFNDLKLPASF